MELSAMIAAEKGFRYYFWSHADVVHLSASEKEPLFAPVVMREFHDTLSSTGLPCFAHY